MRQDRFLLIAGANGYVGRYLCAEALAAGYRVIGLTYDHFAPAKFDDERVRYVRCDIRHPLAAQIESATKEADIAGVINAAALLGSPDFKANEAVNADGVRNLIDFCQQKQIDRLIQISSIVVLKEVKGPYGETKLLGDEIVRSSALNYTIFIPAMVIGPESLGLNRILKNTFRFPLIVPIVGNGRQTQHPVFVGDFVRCIISSVDKPVAHGKTYQIAGDTVIPFRDLIRKILRMRGSRKLLLPVPSIIARWLGKIFERTQRVPLFTEEHVKGVLQNSRLDIREVAEDLGYAPSRLDNVLAYCLGEIHDNWSSMLSPSPERILSAATNPLPNLTRNRTNP